MGPKYSTTPQSKKTIVALWRLLKIILESLDFNIVVQEIVDSVLLELGYLKLGYEIAVLCLIDDKSRVLQRISISHTEKAKQALDKTPVPFHEIAIPLNYKHNFLIKAIQDKKPYASDYWPDILMPSFTKKDATQIQIDLGIKASLIYPVLARNTAIGVIIFSMSKSPSKVTTNERDLIQSFTDIVGLAVQNASLYSEVDRANLKLQKANKDLRRLDKLKDEFVFIATHDLKNPVTAMKGYLYMLEKGMYGQIPTKIQEAVEQIRTSNRQLVQLVDDLLQIARAESKTIKIKTQPIDILEIADELIENNKAIAQEKNLSLVHSRYETKVKVMADPDKIKEVLNNLINNAIKFSEKGTISVSYSSDENRKNHFIVHVADQGLGIPKKDQKKIFSQFFRSDDVAAKGIQGNGLGLFIVKKLVEKMGGTIWFESEPGKGTTFSFSLPKAR